MIDGDESSIVLLWRSSDDLTLLWYFRPSIIFTFSRFLYHMCIFVDTSPISRINERFFTNFAIPPRRRPLAIDAFDFHVHVQHVWTYRSSSNSGAYRHSKAASLFLQRLNLFAMSFFPSASSSGANTSATASATEKDIEVTDPPADSMSSLSFSSAADYLAVGSWDNNVRCFYLLKNTTLNADHSPQVRIYEVGAGGQTQGKAMYQHQGPVLSVCWNKVDRFCVSKLVDSWTPHLFTGR